MAWARWHLAERCLSWWCLAVDGAVLIVGCEWRFAISKWSGCICSRLGAPLLLVVSGRSQCGCVGSRSAAVLLVHAVGCEWWHAIDGVLVRRVHGGKSSRCFVVSGGPQSMAWSAVRWLVVGVLIVGCEWGLTIWTRRTRSAAVLCVNIVGCEWRFATNDVESSRAVDCCRRDRWLRVTVRNQQGKRAIEQLYL